MCCCTFQGPTGFQSLLTIIAWCGVYMNSSSNRCRFRPSKLNIYSLALMFSPFPLVSIFFIINNHLPKYSTSTNNSKDSLPSCIVYSTFGDQNVWCLVF